MFIIWQKQEQFNSFHVTGLYLLSFCFNTNGDETNLILPKFSRPLYFFFSHQLFGTYRNKYFQMKTVNDFAFYLATFSLQNVTGLIAGLDGNIHFSQSNS